MKTLNVRELALNTLLRIEEEGAYSNIAIDEALQRTSFNDADRRLFTTLVYGTLQYRDTLDYYLEPFVQHRLDRDIRMLLRLSVYQIVYLTRIPSHAVVHEAVTISKQRHSKRVSGVVNGILRSLLREPLRSFDEIEDPLKRLAIETSHPVWLIRRWYYQYGLEEAANIARMNNVPPPSTARVNTMKTTPKQVATRLREEGFDCEVSSTTDVSLRAMSGNFAQTTAFKEGLLSVQDESSMLPVIALDPQRGETILDVCAAPGGKTAFIAEKMNDEGTIYAHDIYAHKIDTIDEQASRLGITSIEASVQDGRTLSERYEEESFDRILIDAPCSGFGVIRRKPEIKYEREEKDIQRLAHLQWQIVEEAIPLLKQGGRLVYSTCTIDQLENDQIVQKIKKHYPEMALIESPLHRMLETKERAIQLFPHTIESDGFFIATFEKTN